MKSKHTVFALVVDLILLIASYIIIISLKQGSLSYYFRSYQTPLIVFTAFWLIASLIGQKYRFPKQNLSTHFNSIIRINFIILGLTAIVIYTFHLFYLSRTIVLGSILSVTILEILFAILFYKTLKFKPLKDSRFSLLAKPTPVLEDNIGSESPSPKISEPELKEGEESVCNTLKEILQNDNTELYEFIKLSVPIKNISKNKSFIIDTHTLFNIANVDHSAQQFFVNLHKINDFRRINRYLIQVNKNLEYGGYFVSNGVTIEDRYQYFLQKYTIPISYILYGMDFIFKRVFPKLPGLKTFYFWITKGEDRALSRAEILGRLQFCGFRIVETANIGNKFYFVGQKVAFPCEDKSPSYGPFIKLRRIGKDKKPINIYKLRTMHPYSEYLQDYVYKENELETGGKFKDDFRVTGWAKFFRAVWIDELPQLINLFRGDIGLVGVRALSEHYFNLYPNDLQELRVKFKPGLVPPYFADMPNGFDEIIESERKYLNKKLEHPYLTDIQYFFKAWYNIIFKGARSK